MCSIVTLHTEEALYGLSEQFAKLLTVKFPFRFYILVPFSLSVLFPGEVLPLRTILKNEIVNNIAVGRNITLIYAVEVFFGI